MTAPARTFVLGVYASFVGWTREHARRYGGPDPEQVAIKRELRRQVNALRRENQKQGPALLMATTDRDRLKAKVAELEPLAANAAALEAQRDDAVRMRDLAFAAARRSDEAHAEIAAKLTAYLDVEPPTAEGCTKLRSRDEAEAWRHAARVADETARDITEYDVYRCDTCPRLLLTGARFWHFCNVDQSERTGRDGKRRLAGQRHLHAQARRDGREIDQRLAPDVVARLRQRPDEC